MVRSPRKTERRDRSFTEENGTRRQKLRRGKMSAETEASQRKNERGDRSATEAGNRKGIRKL